MSLTPFTYLLVLPLRKSEELQFRLEEEAIDKTALENQRTDTEERIFELEEALAAAKEANERIEAQLKGGGAAPGPAGDGPAPPPPPAADDSEKAQKLAAAEARAQELEATLKELQEKQLNVGYLHGKPVCCSTPFFNNHPLFSSG